MWHQAAHDKCADFAYDPTHSHHQDIIHAHGKWCGKIFWSFGTFIPNHERYTHPTCSRFLSVHVLYRQEEAEMMRVTSELRVVLAPHITSQWHDTWRSAESLESYQHCEVTHSAPIMGNQRYTRDCWVALLPGSRLSPSLKNTTPLRGVLQRQQSLTQ